MTDVFISYSRKDKDFVKVLHQALTESKYNAWVDWEDIPLTADWWEEIKSGIEQADTFVFVISPDSITSKVCGQEIDHAVTHNKRLVPIVRRDGSDSALIHPALGKHNWLFFQEEDDFDQAFQSLVRALDTDLGYVQVHTRLLVRAIEWDAKQRNDSFLLRGAELQEAEQWLLHSVDKEPYPTEQQKTYIHKSREVEAANQRLSEAGHKAKRMVRLGSGVLAATLVMAAIVGATAARRLQQANFKLKTAELEQRGADALQRFEFKEIEALLLAMQAGQELQVLVHQRQTSEGYPTFSPISALQQILNTVQEQNQYQTLQSPSLLDVSFSPDGQSFVTASANGMVRLWDLQGNLLAEFNERLQVRGVSFSPNGNQLAIASDDGTAYLRDLQGNLLAEFKGHGSGLRDVVFSPNGQLLATASQDQTARLWNLQTKQWVELNGHQGQVLSINFSPDGRSVATTSDDGTLRLWNLQGNQLQRIRHGADQLQDASFSPDGKHLATASNSNSDGIARLWDVNGNQLAEFKGHHGGVFRVDFSPDGRSLLTSSSDNTAILWDLQGNQLARLKGHHNLVWEARFSPNGKHLITVSADGTARLWNLQSQQLAIFRGHQNGVLSANFSPDGTSIVTTSDDSTARLWDTQGNQLAELRGHQHWVKSAAFSPDGQWIATAGADSIVRLWDVRGNQHLSFKAHQSGIYAISFSPEGQFLVTASEAGEANLWDLQGQSLAAFTGEGVVFNPTQPSLATFGYDNSVRLWDFQGTLLSKFHESDRRMTSISFAPDGQMLAIGLDSGTALLLDVTTNQPREFQAHQGNISSIAFSPDGRYLATGSNDRTARLWDLQGNQLAEFKGHQDAVRDVSFSPDGQYLLTASSDGTARLWRVENLDQLLERGCDWLKDYLVTHPIALQTLTVCHNQTLLAQAAPALVREGEDVAKTGDVKAAVALFKAALEWQPDLTVNPTLRAQQFHLVGEGEALAREGNYEGAVVKFEAALELDSTLTLNPTAKAGQIAVPALIRQGRQFLADGKIREAIAAFTQAQQHDPTFPIPVDVWNNLCWEGSLQGYAADVIDACEKAVALNPEDGNIRDSRGLARALTGDTQGAIEDFQFFINKTNNEELKAQRQRWIEALRRGQDPFTPEEIQLLLG